MYFYYSDFWAISACPEKQSCLGIFHGIKYVFFIIQDFWATWACPEKNRIALQYFTVSKYFFIIQDFWATSACPENRVCPEIFQARGGGRPPRLPASYAYDLSDEKLISLLTSRFSGGLILLEYIKGLKR